MDFELARWCNRLGRGTIDGATAAISEISLLIALWCALIVVAAMADRRKGARVLVAVLLALVFHFSITEGLIKHELLHLLPMRVRPYLAHPGEIVAVGHRFTDSSFPSSHAASTGAVLTVFAAFYRWSIPFGAGFLAVMAFSRLHDGMHYPTDVLTGSALGIYGIGAVFLERGWTARRTARKLLHR